MKARNLFATVLATVSLITTFGAFAQNIEATPYRYGMNLDIAKVISIEAQPSQYCEVVPAKMTYNNSAGEVLVLTYTQLSGACASQN